MFRADAACARDPGEKKMKIYTLIVSTIALVVIGGSPAVAANKKKIRHAAVHHEHTAVQQPAFQGGVLKGPLYNGPDYLGDDPDPNIRAYLIKDKTRYIGSF
jgi:hypothetical protein